MIPVIKEKTGKINSKANYRPIALTSIISKVFENILLYRLEDYVLPNANQFGFKSKHGTDMCIYALKEIVLKYRSIKPLTVLIMLSCLRS